jgi:hypothetical protein
MQMRFLFLSIALVTVSISGGDVRGEDAKAEMKKLEGTWTTVSYTSDGKKGPDEKIKSVRLTIKADGTWIMKDDKDSWDPQRERNRL